MPNTDTHGFVAPDDTDPFAPAADMRAGRAPHHSRSIIPVANATARDALAAAHSPTSSKPMVIYRSDVDEHYYTKDGIAYRPIGTGPTGEVARTSAQSFPGGGVDFTTIVWQELVSGSDAIWSGSEPTRVGISRSGWYQINYGITLSSSQSAGQQLRLLRNGATVSGGDRGTPTTQFQRLEASRLIKCTAGDYFELQVLHGGVGSVNSYPSGPNAPIFSLAWVRP
ncbi:MAG: hypothetical protein P1U38_09545 [Aeromicrobium sp.]|uniref:hypothetical protein n=1 Tax=Aeromicrobium sp. TaxID=1871063 RepID=UPI00260B57E7|nr:hypothetical protein [Aeromicrobium sp.]MDF1705004.1 hypothetical protein [Aeromicrobium sp.]